MSIKVYSKIILSFNNDGELINESCEFNYYDGPLSMCGGGSSSGGYKISDEEKAILKSLTENMEFMKSIYRGEQLPYDLSLLTSNKELLPDIFSYTKSQIGDAQKDIAINRSLKDAMADKQLGDIYRQDSLADLEIQQALRADRNTDYELNRNKVIDNYLSKEMDRSDRYNDTTLKLLENEVARNNVNNKFADWEIAQAKSNQSKADNHYGQMVGTAHELAGLSNRFGVQADSAFGDYRGQLAKNDMAMDALSGERLAMLQADLHGVSGRASSDTQQTYAQARDALAREQARLGINPSSGAAMESSRLTGLDSARTNALAREKARAMEQERVENANFNRTQANWGKDLSIIGARNNAMGMAGSLASQMYGQQGDTATAAANALAAAPGSAMEFTKNNIRATDLLGQNLKSSQTQGYGLSAANLLGSRAQTNAPISAKDFSAMLNGGYGVMNGYQGYQPIPQGTDFASASANAGQSAASGPQGVYVPGSGNSALGSALGAAGTLGAAWLMTG